MRSWDEIEADAADAPPFREGAAGPWLAAWCGTCAHEAGSDCPVLGVALMGSTPAEWQPSGPVVVGPWRCTEYERRPNA